MNGLAKTLIFLGLMMIIVGIVLYLLNRVPFSSYHFPGDILIKRKNFVFYFPLGLSILLSIILTLLFRIFK
ncbi:MAG: DUF2905 domain-containing protein [Candidatus Atribacteria bacterium]|nr:DUF2905 domain-containing protein [Candidatus Atribacteria bacterium]